MLKSAASMIGQINFWEKLTRKRSAGNPHAVFDVAGTGNVLEDFSGAPALDPTKESQIDTKKMKILVTGGAGFIGSHLVDVLLSRNYKIFCLDDLSFGSKKFIEHNFNNKNFKFILLDILSFKKLLKIFQENSFDLVIHLAANSDIQYGNKNHKIDLNKNFYTTFNILECMLRTNVKQILFASSSAIYGESSLKLKEDSGPLLPISFYGASKLSAEAYISVYSTSYGIKSWLFRFPNVVGERATHGVVIDFINKLWGNPKRLEILGDGKQEKPYMYVKDLIDAIIFVWEKTSDRLNLFNLGCDSTTSVDDISRIVIKEMNLKNVELVYTGGNKGWQGDVPKFNYDLSKIHSLGWKTKLTSNDAVRLAVRKILREKFIKD